MQYIPDLCTAKSHANFKNSRPDDLSTMINSDFVIHNNLIRLLV